MYRYPFVDQIDKAIVNGISGQEKGKDKINSKSKSEKSDYIFIYKDLSLSLNGTNEINESEIQFMIKRK